jgi:hypothetical protein
MAIFHSPLAAVFLSNAELILVEHYIFIIPSTSTSAVLALRIKMVIFKKMTFVWLLILA